MTDQSKLKPLTGITHISQEQQRVVEILWSMTGLCAGCQNLLLERSPKMCVGVINSSYCAIPIVRNTIGISLYCGKCVEAINVLMKQLRPKEPANDGQPAHS